MYGEAYVCICEYTSVYLCRAQNAAIISYLIHVVDDYINYHAYTMFFTVYSGVFISRVYWHMSNVTHWSSEKVLSFPSMWTTTSSDQRRGPRVTNPQCGYLWELNILLWWTVPSGQLNTLNETPDANKPPNVLLTFNLCRIGRKYEKHFVEHQI